MNTKSTPLKSRHKKNLDRSKHSLRLWLRLFSCESIIEQRIRARLRQTYGITLPQFDVLAKLEYACKPLTMTGLSRMLMVSNGNVTGVTDRLVRNGYVRRIPSRTDRRVQLIELTEAGMQAFSDMAGQHEKWIAELFDFMPLSEMERLSGTLGKISNTLRGGVISRR